MTILNEIVKTKKENLRNVNIRALPPTDKPKRPLVSSLKQAEYPLGVIAEVKKASPSKGVFTNDFSPDAIAKRYESVNVSGISVLTDFEYFQGQNADLTAVKEAVDTPVLRKDFICDEKMITESDKIGADAVLLIAAILEERQFAEYYEYARELGLEVLTEVHNEKELEQVYKHVSPELIGINNRDLHTFSTDMSITESLAPLVPDGSFVISESGIHNAGHIRRLKKAGAGGMLIGEGFMLAESPQLFLNQLFDGGEN
ncbi:indole-3-glycerol phosphate synthase TrpC [Salisediminibacterium halotolerans]|uniref:Indole-3-glycerol phosphate synthase n=1 Tax=Salisediminibacterium halotolerans TaxID=517425 RepID=A0A1H9P350_9BACI|nr:indole-3-glycerol phosphate synthase TrpC [Salisediminibacterium haloalkalitolerans]SER42249.1 indole-3-glycerol phosphate synthase [Salisediminibacterium haloalkalitolerans]